MGFELFLLEKKTTKGVGGKSGYTRPRQPRNVSEGVKKKYKKP